ncbi:protection of telomeres protein 1 isoform X2 [Lethenteron reissneri]|uniref:protection of telomeres protein 1 isoform X2 n=1 Tax=Lethenteron reissneri TaxID=7753 RepID=UPI002AB79A88|nr:protection of telomeres protein 1 isoform X2 [Lethenteron reissneri]
MPVKPLPATSLPDHHCPPGLKRIYFRDLDVGKVRDNRYVKGRICKRFPLITGNTKLIKVVLEEDDAGPSTADGKAMNVFIFGSLALESDKALNDGDVVALSEFLVDKSPHANKDGRHRLQLELSNDDCSCIWTSPPTSSTTLVNNADVSSPPTKRKAKNSDVSYTYVTIDKIREGMVVNVYAAVKFFRPPTSTNGTDHFMILSLVDQSKPEHGLRCMLFGHPEQLPQVTRVGDIVRMHRLKVQLYQGVLQGSSSPGFSTLVFSGQMGASMEPSSTTKNYHLNPAVDHTILLALRQWASERFVSPSYGVCFSEVKPPQFLDIRCQLVAKAVVDHRTTILKVWDGTHCPYPIHCFPIDYSILVSSSDLLQRSRGLVVDIAAYDNHAKTTRDLQLGSFLEILNLHSYLRQSRDKSDTTQGELEFVLHGGGTAFGRAIITLPKDSPELLSLHRALGKVAEEAADALLTDSLLAAADDTDETPEEWQGEAVEGLVGPQEELSDDDTEPRCLQRSATVLTAHHHIKAVALSTVLAAPVPNKHRVRARLIGYRPESILRSIRLHCPRCNALRDIPSQEVVSSVLKGLATWPDDPVVQRSKEDESSLWSHCSEEDAAALEDGWTCRERPVFRYVPCGGRTGAKQASALLVEGTAVTELQNLSEDVGCVIPVTPRDNILTMCDDPVPFVIKKSRSYFRCLNCSQPRAGSLCGLEKLKSFDVNKIAGALGIQPMRYIFTLRFQLRDSTGDIVASLAADEAVSCNSIPSTTPPPPPPLAVGLHLTGQRHRVSSRWGSKPGEWSQLRLRRQPYQADQTRVPNFTSSATGFHLGHPWETLVIIHGVGA